MQNAIELSNHKHGKEAVPYEQLQLLLPHLLLQNQIVGLDSILPSELREQGTNLSSEVAVVLLTVSDIVLHFSFEFELLENASNKGIKLLLYLLVLNQYPADHILPVVGGEPQGPLVLVKRTMSSYDLLSPESESF